MIKVKVLKENDFYKEIIITGHANYDSYGKDIVCSSVSSIVVTTVNAIISLDKDAMPCSYLIPLNPFAFSAFIVLA